MFSVHSRKRLVLGINVLVLLVITVVFFVTKKAPDDIELSKSAGFYKDEVSIEIKSKGNYEIHYTLDSSAPTISSPKYEETLNFRNASSNENIYSIRTDTAPGYIAQEVEELGERVRTVYHTPTYLVPKCNVLRVASFDTTGELVDEKTVSVFVDNKNDVAFDNVLVASVTTDPENLFNYEEGIYIMGERWDKGIYSPNRPEGYDLWNANYRYTSSYGQKEAHLELFDKNGNSLFYYEGKRPEIPWDYRKYDIEIDNALLKGEIEQIAEGYSAFEEYLDL